MIRLKDSNPWLILHLLQLLQCHPQFKIILFKSFINPPRLKNLLSPRVPFTLSDNSFQCILFFQFPLLDEITFLQKSDTKVRMFNLIKNTHLIEEACQQFLDPHPCDYSFNREIILLSSKNRSLRLEEEDITTKVQVKDKEIKNQIKLHFIVNTSNDDNCIIYLHGLSSYCLEGKFLIPYLANNFSLCLFDSRSHGKNAAPYVTYGLLQSEELIQILQAVLRRGYRKIILWGRSMGAVACLRAIQQHSSEQVLKHIKYVVADSPFGSFQMIATEIISKMTSLPSIFSSVVASAFSSKILERFGIDLNQISLENFNSNIPVAFYYSSCDEMMGIHHIEAISQNYKGVKDLCDLKLAHNDQRPPWMILQALSKVYNLLKEKPIDEMRKRGLSITKLSSQKFLSVVTPSNIDGNMRKSLRLVPQLHNHKQRPSHHGHYKENSLLLTPQVCIPQMKKSAIISETNFQRPSTRPSMAPLGKSSQNIGFSYF